ncbi:hypothetical protein AVEN_174851-1 [Araneus ventricosus]|uniref:Uncharacterized protein n=1 Tax=Araneus ventricosus TaxID=182803 RepID=A0A4Y2MWX1_ARAVE|nr:hypothetical protein AVEN_174851-1 [Araneus ventricosus]
MRLLTELQQLGFLTSSGTVASCVLAKIREKWTPAAECWRLEMYCIRAWVGLQYWSSSHRLKINLFFSNMGDGSRNAL